jgi:hypothetical protein
MKSGVLKICRKWKIELNEIRNKVNNRTMSTEKRIPEYIFEDVCPV